MNTKLLALLSAFLSVAAQAQTTTPVPATVPADSKEPVVVQAPAAPVATAHCLKSTGTRIVHKDKQACLGVAGSSYDQDELRRTGANDIGDALQKLDPSISVHH